VRWKRGLGLKGYGVDTPVSGLADTF